MEINTEINSIINTENLLKMDELTEDEFKTKIIKWFKDRGLLSKMRTHMRYQMITYLRETQIGNMLAEKSIQKTILAKERTIHFLVAEYLLHNQNYYSLSILVSEVSFLNVFPDMTAIRRSFTSVNNSPDEQIKQFRFDQHDINDFIQSLGILKNSLEAEQICKFYLKNSNYSLLSIILRVLIERTVITSESSDKSIDFESIHENETINYRWNNVVYNLLKKALLKGSNIYVMRDRIIRFFINEFDRIRIDSDEKQKIEFGKMKDVIENEFECKEIYLKKNLLELEQKFNKERNFYINSIAEKDKTIGKLRCELQKFEKFNEQFQKLKQKCVKEEESKKRYKETTQILKKECFNLQDQLKSNTEIDSEKDKVITNLHEELQEVQEDMKVKIINYEKEITKLKTANVKLNEEIEQEKTGTVLHQVKYQQEISKNHSLLSEITELKTKNQTLENYLNELNKRSEDLNRQFQSTMKSLESVSQTKIAQNEKNSKKSNRRKVHKTSSSTSESLSSSNSVQEILSETKQRLENLQAETQLIEANYNKKRVKSSPRFLDLWRTTQFINQNNSTNISDQHVLNTEILVHNSKPTNFDHCTNIRRNTSPHSKSENETLYLSHNQKTIELKSNSDQVESPHAVVSKLPPLFEALNANIIESFHNFHSTVLEVSRDIKTFVESTSKLSENVNQCVKSDTVNYEFKTSLEKEFPNEIEPKGFENDNISELMEKTDSSSSFESREFLQQITEQFYEISTKTTATPEMIIKTSPKLSKSIQTINSEYKNNPLENSNTFQNKTAKELKLDLYETTSMHLIYENVEEKNKLEKIQQIDRENFQEPSKLGFRQRKKYENFQEPSKLGSFQATNKFENLRKTNKLENFQEPVKLGNFQANSKLEKIKKASNVENLQENKKQPNNQKYPLKKQTPIDDNVKETESEYIIEKVEISSPPRHTDCTKTRNKKHSSVHSMKNTCHHHHRDTIQPSCSKDVNLSSVSSPNRILSSPSMSVNDEDNSPSENLKKSSSQILYDGDSPTPSIQNIIQALLDQVCSSTETIVSIIDDEGKKDEETKPSIHLLEKISIDDLRTSSGSRESNSPMSAGFDNKNDDFWM